MVDGHACCAVCIRAPKAVFPVTDIMQVLVFVVCLHVPHSLSSVLLYVAVAPTSMVVATISVDVCPQSHADKNSMITQKEEITLDSKNLNLQVSDWEDQSVFRYVKKP